MFLHKLERRKHVPHLEEPGQKGEDGYWQGNRVGHEEREDHGGKTRETGWRKNWQKETRKELHWR